MSVSSVLTADEVRVFYAEPQTWLGDESRQQELFAWLSEEERARCKRFVQKADQLTYLAAHSLLRFALGLVGQQSPDHWEFKREPQGRPVLTNWAGEKTLWFSLTHTRGMVAAALAPFVHVGIDVESSGRSHDALLIAEEHFAPEETAWLRRLDPADLSNAFYSLWTRKEAILKALGTGLHSPMSGVRFALPQLELAHLDAAFGQPSRGWTVIELNLPKTAHKISVVARTPQGDPARVQATRLNSPALGR